MSTVEIITRRYYVVKLKHPPPSLAGYCRFAEMEENGSEYYFLYHKYLDLDIEAGIE